MVADLQKLLFISGLLLQAGCAQLNLASSQESAPIESREAIGQEATEIPEPALTTTPESSASQADEMNNDIIAITPLDDGGVGRPEPLGSNAVEAPAANAPSQASEQLLADARKSFVVGDLATAEAITNRGLRIAPADPALWLQLAKIRVGQKSYAEAVSLSERAQVLAENDLGIQIDALQIMAHAERGRGNLERAKELEEQVRALNGRLGDF